MLRKNNVILAHKAAFRFDMSAIYPINCGLNTLFRF